MTRFKLVIRPDGRAFLTTAEQLSQVRHQELIGVVRDWEDGKYPVLIIPDCEVVQVADLEVQLGEPVAL